MTTEAPSNTSWLRLVPAWLSFTNTSNKRQRLDEDGDNSNGLTTLEPTGLAEPPQPRHYSIRKFDITKIRGGADAQGVTCVLIGKRNTGKTWLVRDFLYQVRDAAHADVFVSYEEKAFEYTQTIPAEGVHVEGVTAKNIQAIVNRQNAKKERAVVVLEDCFHTHHQSRIISPIVCNGRHLALSAFIIMHYPLSLGRTAKRNVDYVFISRNPIVNERRELYKQYGGMFPTFESFCGVLDACTDNYECLVIDNATRSNNLEDLVFWYKASPHDAFVVGGGDAADDVHV
jgi:hypothetical protein